MGAWDKGFSPEIPLKAPFFNEIKWQHLKLKKIYR